jgi:hypothetical protein
MILFRFRNKTQIYICGAVPGATLHELIAGIAWGSALVFLPGRELLGAWRAPLTSSRYSF